MAADPRSSVDRAGHGTAVWSSSAWRHEAVTWLDRQLADAGIDRTGDVDQPHLQPWATLLRAPTTAGTVWLKAAAPNTAFEVRLYELLARVAPDRVLTPVAADAGRGWIVLPDGGATIGDRLSGDELTAALVAALVPYGRLQVELAPHVDELLALGVSDMRPAVMPERFEEALDTTGAAIDRTGDPTERDVHREVAALRPSVARWCEQLAGSSVPPSLDHNDLHPWNVLGDGPAARFYDWGDSVVAHPFAALLVPLGMIQQQLGAGLDDERYLQARDAYLEVFTAGAPDEDLVATLEVACRVAKIARALTWDRALQAARDEGTDIAPEFVNAPMETLASLLAPSYLGGA